MVPLASKRIRRTKETIMGRLCIAGKKNVEDCSSGYYANQHLAEYLRLNPNPRIGLILGTGWSNPDVLKDEGFQLEFERDFRSLGLNEKSGSGHPNMFKFGTWHGKDVVISCGRFHLFQDYGKFGEDSLIRRWMSMLLYFMNDSRQVVIASAVGGLHDKMKEDMLVMPTGIVSADVPQPYLIGSEGEFLMSEHLLWPSDKYVPTEQFKTSADSPEFSNCICEPISEALSKGFHRLMVFASAVKAAECEGTVPCTHHFIPGPGFGGATERRVWAKLGFDTVGMSLDPELRLIALENNDNRPKGVKGAYHETDIRVFPTLFVSDSHDMPDNDEIQARAIAMAPKLGKFLSEVVKAEW